MAQEVQIEAILNKIMDFDIYFRDMMRLDLPNLQHIKEHVNNVVGLDSDEEEAEEPEFNNCDHPECHVFRCKSEAGDMMESHTDILREQKQQPLQRRESTQMWGD